MLVEALCEILDQSVEFRLGDFHALVRIPHALSRVGTGTTCRLTYLIDEHLLQVRDIGFREARVDALIGRDICNEVIDDCGDGIFAAQAVVERSRRDGGCVCYGGNSGVSGLLLFMLNTIS